MSTKGHCLCKKISWQFTGNISWACYCHCDDCRRNCAAPVVAWLGGTLNTYTTDDGVYRHFCGHCGSPIGFEADYYAGGMHLYAASLDNPADFKPDFHVNYESKLPWLKMQDELTKYEGTLLGTPNDLSGYQ